MISAWPLTFLVTGARFAALDSSPVFSAKHESSGQALSLARAAQGRSFANQALPARSGVALTSPDFLVTGEFSTKSQAA